MAKMGRPGSRAWAVYEILRESHQSGGSFVLST